MDYRRAPSTSFCNTCKLAIAVSSLDSNNPAWSTSRYNAHARRIDARLSAVSSLLVSMCCRAGAARCCIRPQMLSHSACIHSHSRQHLPCDRTFRTKLHQHDVTNKGPLNIRAWIHGRASKPYCDAPEHWPLPHALAGLRTPPGACWRAHSAPCSGRAAVRAALAACQPACRAWLRLG